MKQTKNINIELINLVKNFCEQYNALADTEKNDCGLVLSFSCNEPQTDEDGDRALASTHTVNVRGSRVDCLAAMYQMHEQTSIIEQYFKTRIACDLNTALEGISEILDKKEHKQNEEQPADTQESGDTSPSDSDTDEQ